MRDVSVREDVGTANPTNWHRNVGDNFIRLPHPHHPDQQCWKPDTIIRPALASSDKNRITPKYQRLAWFCNNSTSLILNLTFNRHATILLSSLQSLNSCSQLFHACTPQLAFLNITLCTKPKTPSCWFQTLEPKMLLNSDSGHRAEFQICRFTYLLSTLLHEQVVKL